MSSALGFCMYCRSVAEARNDPDSSFVLRFQQGRTLWHPLHIHCTITRNMCTWIEEIPGFALSLNLGNVKVRRLDALSGKVGWVSSHMR